jgi:hypothetical protein
MPRSTSVTPKGLQCPIAKQSTVATTPHVVQGERAIITQLVAQYDE